MNFPSPSTAAAMVVRVALRQRKPIVGRTATTLLVAGALAHTFVIGMQTMEVGHVPIAGTTSLHFDVRLAAGPRVSLHRDDDRRTSDGYFILPLARRAAGDSGVHAGRPRTAPPVLQGPLFGLHVSSLLFAYASFALACVIGITYVLLFKEIKAKHLGFFYARLPSLQVLDSMNQRAIVVGWVFLTIGLIVGALWTTQVRAYAGDPRVQAMSLQDPKIFVAMVCWAVYSFEVFARAATSAGAGGVQRICRRSDSPSCC